MAFNWKGPEGPRARPERPTEERPFVYHLFGRLDDLSSLVLSEDDYFAWLYAWAIRHGKSVPPSVLEALAGKHLLFLGYPLDDWDFRVVFQSIWNLGGSALLRRNQHFGVQSTRESQMFERTAVKEYMESYFGRANVSIYWGETREFLSQLRHRLATMSENPYVGPRAFRTGERLPARDLEAADLTDLLIAERVVLLHSPSGAGKTSLIQAGVVPLLEKKHIGSNDSTESFTPCGCGSRHRHPRIALCTTATSTAPRSTSSATHDPGELASLTFPEVLRRVRQQLTSGLLVLIFDQFEEILTLDPADRDAQEVFFQELGLALDRGDIWALFSMREDYVGGLDPFLQLPS